MKVEAGLVCLRSKLSKPCRKLLRVFKFRMKKPFSIKSLWPRRPRSSRAAAAISKPRRTWPSLFRWLRRAGKMDRVRELRGGAGDGDGVSDGSREKLLFPSPRGRKAAAAGLEEEVEDACRSFENYLVEMIIEEGKVRDLMDVEELLYCWRNLKCPVFVDLVCRFYGELCKDLFSPDNEVFTPNLQPSKN